MVFPEVELNGTHHLKTVLFHVKFTPHLYQVVATRLERKYWRFLSYMRILGVISHVLAPASVAAVWKGGSLGMRSRQSRFGRGCHGLRV